MLHRGQGRCSGREAFTSCALARFPGLWAGQDGQETTAHPPHCTVQRNHPPQLTSRRSSGLGSQCRSCRRPRGCTGRHSWQCTLRGRGARRLRQRAGRSQAATCYTCPVCTVGRFSGCKHTLITGPWCSLPPSPAAHVLTGVLLLLSRALARAARAVLAGGDSSAAAAHHALVLELLLARCVATVVLALVGAAGAEVLEGK